RRPALAAGAAAAAVVLGAGVVGFLGSTGAGALEGGGFGPVAAHGHAADGTGSEPSDADGTGSEPSDGLSVTSLTTAPDAPGAPGATVEVELAAQRQSIDLPSGRSIAAWTFGELAGPALDVRVGDTLAVRVTDLDVAAGVTVHWHGYPVANAFDGVAGVTQDAVLPGEELRAGIPMTRPGTYWYHTHQRGSQGVVRGLYGTLVVHPASGPTEDVDLVLPVHTFSGAVVLGTSDVLETRTVAPGQSVRLRLINTDQAPQTFAVQGTPFRVAALDGTDVTTGILQDRALVVPAGGRIDVVFGMPDEPVRVGVASDRGGGLALVPSAGSAVPTLTIPETAFDPVTDLVAAPAGSDSPHADADAAIEADLAGAGFDVERTLLLDRLPRLVQGAPNYAYTVDGRVYPFIEPTVVSEGDVVRLRFVNRGFETHPMHPHGHAVRVLAVDGRVPAAPLWLDTFDVGPGEVWEVALDADNPGIWMDHCHNLEHAALGMVTHLAYRGVTTPFEHGGPAGNAPE
ncbi:multicopper oxidase family protein, partial [Microbacterium sp.]|uniref:multicopper oxidase family protein n=1 Tax=Microbacterium sp. TaxID=51671 RepID=UPI0039E6D92B